MTVPAFLLVSKPVKREFPHFPKGVRGKVTVKFTVNKEGRVIKAEATEGPPDLRKPVEEAVKKSQFQPFLILGKPVEGGKYYVLFYPATKARAPPPLALKVTTESV